MLEGQGLEYQTEIKLQMIMTVTIIMHLLSIDQTCIEHIDEFS